LGDRACLGTAYALKARAVTAERLWKEAAAEIEVELIREKHDQN